MQEHQGICSASEISCPVEAPTLDQSNLDRQQAQVRSQEPPGTSKPHIPHYQLSELLGSGSFGQVWGGVSQRTGLEVAVKVFLTQPSAAHWSYLRQEVERLGKVAEHPHVVSLLDADFDHQPAYFVMRRYQGSLYDWRQQHPQPRLATLIEWWKEITEALRYTHSKGLLHCDLKPSNLLLDEENRALLSDFGQAAQGKERGSSHLGSLGFMAPEQASQLEEGNTSPDVTWDLYSLGATFYYLFSKRLPRLSDGLLQELGSVAGTAEKLSRYRRSLHENALVPIRSYVPQLSEDLAAMLEACLALDPRARPQSAAELLEDFQRSRELKPLLCRRPWSRSYQAGRLARRYLAPILVAASLLVLGGGMAAQRYMDQQRMQATSDLERGMTALNEGRKMAAAHWFSRSLSIQPGQSAPRWLLQEDPAHLQFYQQTGQSLNQVGFSHDGNLLYASGEGGARTYDLRTGRAHGLRLGGPGARPSLDSNGYHNLPPAVVAAGNRRLLVLAAQTALYDLDSGQKLSADLPPAYQAHMSQDGSRGVLFGPQGCFRLTVAPDGQVQTVPILISKDLRAQAISPDGQTIVVGAGDGVVWLCEPDAKPRPLRDFQRPLDALGFTPDGKWLFLSAENQEFRLYEVATGAWVDLKDGHYPVTGLSFSADSKRMAVSCWNGVTHLFQVPEAAHVPVKPALLFRHKWLTYNSVFSPDGQLLVTFALDGTARVYETASGRPLSPFLEHSSPVKSVAFRPGSSLEGALDLATGCEDGSLRVFRLDLKSRPLPLAEGGRGYQVEYSPDGGCLAVACENLEQGGWLELRRAGQPSKIVALPGPSHYLSWAPDGTRLAAAAGNSVWWVSAQGNIQDELELPAPVTCLETSARGLLAVGCLDGSTRLFQGSRLQARLQSEGGHKVSAVHFSRDGRLLATASGNRADIWKEDGSRVAGTVAQDLVRQVAFSPDGKRLAVGSSDKTAQVFQIEDGLQPLLNPPIRHELGICEVAFSPDGLALATASVDGVARLWDSQRGTPLISGLRHPGPISKLRFSPDGKKLVTCTKTGTAFVWGRDGRLLASPIEHSDFIYSAAFRPDSQQLTTCSVDGCLQQRDLTPPPATPAELLQREVEQRTGMRIQVESGTCRLRALTPEEWSVL